MEEKIQSLIAKVSGYEGVDLMEHSIEFLETSIPEFGVY